MARQPDFSPASLSRLESERDPTHHRSAWGGDLVEDSTSGFTAEVVNFQPSRHPREINNFSLGADRPLAWHPKLTLYRLLVIFSTIGLGAAKAATSYLNLTYASITLEWVLTVVVFLGLHFLGAYEEAHTRQMSWFFKVDYLDYLWDFLHTFAYIHRPYYTNEEDNSPHILPSGRPPLTGYRLLVTSTVFIVGMTKSALVYGNRQTEATTVECVFGVFIVTGLYWLGLYEASSIQVYPTLFHVDYSAGVLYFLTTGSNVVWFLLHLIGICLAAGFTYGCSYLVYAMYATDWSTPSLPPFVAIMHKAFFTTLSLFICCSGLSCMFLLLANLYKHSKPFRVSRSGRYMAKLPGLVIFKRIYENYWLPTPPSHQKGRIFYLKRVLIRQVIKLPLNLLFLFIISAVLVICAWPSAQWISLLIVSMDSPLLAAWLLASVVVIPAMGFCYWMMFWGLCRSVGHFLLDVRRDCGWDLDNNLPV